MKPFIAVALTILVTACSTMERTAQGFGEDMSSLGNYISTSFDPDNPANQEEAHE